MRHNTVWPRVQLRLLLSVRMCLCIIAVALAGYTGERFRVFLGGDDPVRQLMRATVALVFTTVLVEIPALVVPLVHLARGSLTPALMTRMSAALAFLWAVAMGLCAGTLGFDVNLSEKHEEMAGLLAVIILQVITTLCMLVWSSNIKRRGYGEPALSVQPPAMLGPQVTELPAKSAHPTSLPTLAATATIPYRCQAQAVELPTHREPVPAQELPRARTVSPYRPHQVYELSAQPLRGHPTSPRPGSPGYITGPDTIVVDGVVYRAVTPGQPSRHVAELYGS